MKLCPHCNNFVGPKTVKCKFCNNIIEKKKKSSDDEINNPSLDDIIEQSIQVNQITKIEENKNEKHIKEHNENISPLEKKKKSSLERENRPRLIKGKFLHYLEGNPIYPIKVLLNWKITPDYFSTFLKNNKLDLNEVYKETYREYFIKINDKIITDEDLDNFLSSIEVDITNIKPEEVLQLIKTKFSLNDCYWKWVHETKDYCEWLKRPAHSRFSLREVGVLGAKWAELNRNKIKELYQSCNYFE